MNDDVKTVEIPAAPTARRVTPKEYMEQFHRVLHALDLPAELDGNHVRYGEMSEAEGPMALSLINLIDARFVHVRTEGDEAPAPRT